MKVQKRIQIQLLILYIKKHSKIIIIVLLKRTFIINLNRKFIIIVLLKRTFIINLNRTFIIIIVLLKRTIYYYS